MQSAVSAYRVLGPLSRASESFWSAVGEIFSDHYAEARASVPAAERAPRYKELCLAARARVGGALIAAAKVELFTGGAVLRSLAVAPHARRAGVGSALLSSLLARAAAAGARVVSAELPPPRSGAGGEELLRGAGFVVDFVRERWGGGDAHEDEWRVYLSRVLSGDTAPPPKPPPAGVLLADAQPWDEEVGAFLAAHSEASEDFAFAVLAGGEDAGSAAAAAAAAASASAAELLACCAGRIESGALHIGVLVVRKEWRRRGVGAVLLARAEALAAARGCHAIAVETFCFQAPLFYEAYGYARDYSLRGWSAGAELLYYSKRLLPPAPSV